MVGVSKYPTASRKLFASTDTFGIAFVTLRTLNASTFAGRYSAYPFKMCSLTYRNTNVRKTEDRAPSGASFQIYPCQGNPLATILLLLRRRISLGLQAPESLNDLRN